MNPLGFPQNMQMQMPGMIAMSGIPGGMPGMMGQPFGIINSSLLQQQQKKDGNSKESK